MKNYYQYKKPLNIPKSAYALDAMFKTQAYNDWVHDPSNEYNCLDCPHGNGDRYGCGQQHCWVTIHIAEQECSDWIPTTAMIGCLKDLEIFLQVDAKDCISELEKYSENKN